MGRRETGITSAAAVFWLNQRVSFVFETSRFLFDKTSGSNTHAGVPHLPKWRVKYRARCCREQGGKAEEDVEAQGLVTILVELVDQRYIYYTYETALQLSLSFFFFLKHSYHFHFLADAGF